MNKEKAINWYVPIVNDTRVRSGYPKSGQEVKQEAINAIMIGDKK